jgi:hypothetical protein
MNAGSTPRGVLGNHAEDQVSDLFREPFSTDPLSRSGDEAPVKTEARSMPTNQSFRGDQNERLFPPRPPGASFGVNERREQGVRTRDRTSGTWTKVIAGERGEEISQVVDFAAGQNFGELQLTLSGTHTALGLIRWARRWVFSRDSCVIAAFEPRWISTVRLPPRTWPLPTARLWDWLNGRGNGRKFC